MKKTVCKSILILSFLILFGGSLSLFMINASAEPIENTTIHTATMTVFDQYYSNWDHPAVTTIDIPCHWQIISCRLEYDGYCDPDDWYLRAIPFWLDWRGGCIGTERVGPHDVYGYGVISPGQTKHWVFDMSNCQIAKNWSDGYGSVYWNFIPQDEGDRSGYFSSGEHTIKSFISSQDFCSGATQDSWISIVLYFEYIDLIENTLNEISSNLDELEVLIDGNLNSGWYKTQCEKYLRFSIETVDIMIEKHLSGDSITSYEVFKLYLYILVIQRFADDPEIFSICDNIMNLIHDLEECIPPLLSIL